MTATLTNGRPQRKQLSDQLDRLDGLIDCLADALPEAVAGAFQEGARQAIREAIVEVLTNPAMRALMAPAGIPSVPVASDVPAEPKVSLRDRLKARFARLKSRVRATLASCRQRMAPERPVLRPATEFVRAAARLAWHWKLAIVVALGAGIATAAASYCSSHGLAAVLSGIGGTAITLAFQVGLWIRGTVQKLTLR